MAFWKKVTGRNSSASIPKSKSLPGPAGRDLKSLEDSDGSSLDYRENGGRFQGNAGPLADFLTDIEEKSVDLGQAQPTWQILTQKSSRLSKTILEFLNDPPSLGYLIQYLEARDAAHLVKFYLDVQSFRCSANTKLTSSYLPPQVDRGRLERVPEDCSLDPGSADALPSSPTSIDTTEGSNLVSESADSFDSGFSKSDCELSKVDQDRVCSPGSKHETDSLASTDTISESLSNQEYGCEKETSRAQSLLRNRTEDAVKIYRKYIAPDSSNPVHIPTEMKKEIVEQICDESGLVSPNCFDDAQSEVLRTLETEFYPDFLESEYHAKHQVDVLTGGSVTVTDILFNDIALFHFMEFMESEGQRPVVEFWMSANNFHQSVSRVEDMTPGETTHDAMILYDKFFSMQATTPLGFDDKIRLEIENNICQESGPGIHCFARPLELIVKYMECRFLHKFLNSNLFKNYVKELIATIQLSTRNFSSITRSTSNDSLSSCSSDTASSRVSHGGLSKNTLLASGDRILKSHKSSSERLDGLCIDYGFLIDPDSIWKRKPLRSKVGKVDYLGRYHSGWEQAPDVGKDKSILGKVKRLGRGDHSKLQEEMAWQVAEMFVKDVMSVTRAEDNTPEVTESPSASDRKFSLHSPVDEISLELTGEQIAIKSAKSNQYLNT